MPPTTPPTETPQQTIDRLTAENETLRRSAVDVKRSWLRRRYDDVLTRGNNPVVLGGLAAAGGYGVQKALATESALRAGSYLTSAPALTTAVPSVIVGTGAYKAARYLGANRTLSAMAAGAAGGAAIATESHFTIPIATTIASLWAANKAVQWSGLNRSTYASMDGADTWSFTKRNIISTPGKMAMGLFYSGWWPSLNKDLRWQERIGAAGPQLLRGCVRSFYTPWDKLQGFEHLPGLVIRPVVSAVSTVLNAIPGSGYFKSPDKFGEGVGNLALSPIRGAKWLLSAPSRFWNYATSVPGDKK